MKTLILLLSLISVADMACKKDPHCGCTLPYQIYYLKAIVIDTYNLDCHRPLLDFTEDSARIHAISQLNTEKFIMTSLNSDLNILNKKLYVSVRVLQSGEYFPCTAMGPSYPALKLTDAKPRD